MINCITEIGGLAISSSSILSSVGAGSSNGVSVVSSGLSELESEYLLQWVRGVNSGRSTRKCAPETPPPAFFIPTYIIVCVLPFPNIEIFLFTIIVQLLQCCKVCMCT